MIHICIPQVIRWRRILDCACGPRRRHVIEDHVWYEAIIVCCRCGRQRSTERGHLRERRTWRECDRLWRDAHTRKEAARLLAESFEADAA